jgi:predicted transcriptional regulator
MPKAIADRSIGDQELSLLRHLSGQGASTVGEVADSFGGPRGLARSTVLTMMERLRQKGYLTRRLIDGVYRYSPKSPTNDVLRWAVRQFVQRTLGGEVSPVVAYLVEDAEVTDEELRELEALVDRLQGQRRKGGPRAS